MTYTINKSDGTTLLSLPDQTADTSATPLTLIGRGLRGFGRAEAENFVHLLENFANATAPAHPMVGQFWYDKALGKMKVWNGTVWLRALLGLDDTNVVPGLGFGAGLTLASGVLSANVRLVAGRAGDVTLGVSDVAGAAPLVSPSLSGIPTAPTATTGTTSTQIATTAYVRAQVAADTLNYGAGSGLTVAGNNLAVVGTTNRISVSASGVDIASTYAGQNSISTLGNITAGQWSGSAVGVAFGGTGATTAAAARANLSALQFSTLADSLRTLSSNGILVNNAGTSIARAVVSGSPDTISVVNGNGVGGDITISLIGGNSGPTQITGGGTGATTKNAALNALSPLAQNGQLMMYNNGVHDAVAPHGDASIWYLYTGGGSPLPRYRTDVDATTVGGKSAAQLLDRANHTGTNNANTLGGQPPAYFLDYANFTGSFPSTAVTTNGSNLAAMQLGESGYVRFNGGLTWQWGRVSGYFGGEGLIPVTFPVAFSTTFSVVANVITAASKYEDWYTLIVNNSISTSGFNLFNNNGHDFKGQANMGFNWFAIGYIA